MSKKKKKKLQQLISLYTQGLKGILVKYHLIKWVKQVKWVSCDGHKPYLFIKRDSCVNLNLTRTY